MRRGPLIEATLEEVGEAHEDCRAEVQRMLQLHHDYTADEDAIDICYHCQEEGQSLAHQSDATSGLLVSPPSVEHLPQLSAMPLHLGLSLSYCT